MTPKDFATSMTFLSQAYDKEFSKEKLAVWYEFFKDDSDSDLTQAIMRLIPKSKFLPAIAELKAEIASMNSHELQLKPEEEWDKVQRAIHRYGIYNAEEAEKSLDPYTRSVVKHMGGIRQLCLLPEDDWPRKNFMNLWSEMKEAGVNVRVMDEKVLTVNELSLLAAEKVPLIETHETGSSFDEQLAIIQRRYHEHSGLPSNGPE